MSSIRVPGQIPNVGMDQLRAAISSSINPSVIPLVSTDQAQGDNQPVEAGTYRVKPWKGNDWLDLITVGRFAFVRHVHPLGSSEGSADQSFVYAFTPEQLNAVLVDEAIERFTKKNKELLTPSMVTELFKLAGVVRTETDKGVGKRSGVQHRTMVIHARGKPMVDNYWMDCKGTDDIAFMVKFVDISLIKRAVLGPCTTIVFDFPTEYTPRVCPQVVAIRLRENVPRSILSTQRVPGDPKKGKIDDPLLDHGLMACGEHIPVGNVRANDMMTEYDRNDELHEYEGVPCHDAIRPMQNHIQVVLLSI